MKNGYRVYIANAEVKGKEWMRLRVGFFRDRPKAAAAGKEMVSMLKAGDAWVTKLEKSELEEFGGY
jgi:septal ring-binding cell division protein DamX